MKLVDSALFALILDDHTPSCPNEMTRTFLHGDAANRYNCFAFFHFINHIIKSYLQWLTYITYHLISLLVS